MDLILVRHGTALEANVDPARGLSPAGRVEATRTAAFLKQAGISVARIVHSGKARAAQTAAIVGRAIAPGLEPKERAGLKPMDDVAPAADLVGAAGEDLLIAGHLPFLARLAAKLLTGKEEPFFSLPPAGAAGLTRGEGGRWVLRWLVSPALLPPADPG